MKSYLRPSRGATRNDVDGSSYEDKQPTITRLRYGLKSSDGVAWLDIGWICQIKGSRNGPTEHLDPGSTGNVRALHSAPRNETSTHGNVRIKAAEALWIAKAPAGPQRCMPCCSEGLRVPALLV